MLFQLQIQLTRGESVFAVDLPFQKAFKHAAAERHSSYSLFVKRTTYDGHGGYGECLPR